MDISQGSFGDGTPSILGMIQLKRTERDLKAIREINPKSINNVLMIYTDQNAPTDEEVQEMAVGVKIYTVARSVIRDCVDYYDRRDKVDYLTLPIDNFRVFGKKLMFFMTPKKLVDVYKLQVHKMMNLELDDYVKACMEKEEKQAFKEKGKRCLKKQRIKNRQAAAKQARRRIRNLKRKRKARKR